MFLADIGWRGQEMDRKTPQVVEESHVCNGDWRFCETMPGHLLTATAISRPDRTVNIGRKGMSFPAFIKI